MLKAPRFWYKKNDTYLSNVFYPLSLLFSFGTKCSIAVGVKPCEEILLPKYKIIYLKASIQF